MRKNYIAAFILLLLFSFGGPVAAKDGGVESLRQTSRAFATVAREVSPSVVFIQVEGKVSSPQMQPFPAPFGDDFFRHFFGEPMPGVPGMPQQPQSPQQQQRVISQGSGFVFAAKDGLFSKKTYILTNNHVVANADKISVRFQDGREFDGKITGRDPQSDVAVIEIKASGLPVLPMADSSKLQVGEWVVAIGNPFGLSNTLTVGVVSATGRTSIGITDYEDFIQTDAAINPGNSGGPLVNLDGEVVGINSAIFSRSGGYMGIGFAIPSNLAKAIATQLIDKGEVIRGYLGIAIQPLTPDLARSFAMDQNKGILVAQVSKDSPAQQAGLQQGDVIIAYRGKPVSNPGLFRNRVALTPPGSKVELTILRNAQRQKLTVTIGKLSKDKLLAQGPAQSTDEIGLTVQTLTRQLAEQFHVPPGVGVVVTEVKPGSIAAMAGIEPGTVILQVNRKTVKSAAEFQSAIEANHASRRVLLLIRQGNIQRYVALSW